MVNLQKSGDSAVKIVFTDSDHYLYGNGEIEVPVNSLLLVIDDSEMVTFKKLSGDPFLSFRADNSSLGTKAAIEQFYKENMVGSTGGGSVTIDPTLDSGSTNPVANSAITTALDAKQDISKLPNYIYSSSSSYGSNRYLSFIRTDKKTGASSTDLLSFARINNKGLVGSNDVFSLLETSAITTSITSASTNDEVAGAKAVYDAIQAGGGGGMDDDTQQLISTAFNDLNDRKADLTELSKYQKKGDYVKTSTLADYMTNDAFDEYATAKERIISGALNDLDNRMIAVESGGSVTVDTTLDSGSTNPVQNAVITQALNSKVDTSAITTAITSGSTDSEIPTAKATYDAIQAGGGGGATYSAGTNISIANDVISVNLPIEKKHFWNGDGIAIIGNTNSFSDAAYSAGIGLSNRISASRAFILGTYCQAKAQYSVALNANNIANAQFSLAANQNTTTNNVAEAAFGTYNNSVTGSTTSGQTLFSVGNGTSSARHNAFEIRQNGDIYVNDGTNDVKLQDTITATTANTTALGGLKLVKLTQAEYDALATKDSSTLYIISD